MTINGDITITNNYDNTIQALTIYNNDNTLLIEFAGTLASLEAIHNTKTNAHENLFSVINQKNSAQDEQIATLASLKADKSEIQTVNNATLTITQGGTIKGTFSANAAENVTIDIDESANTISIDENFDSDSENPIQNKTITNALNNKANKDLSNCTKPYIVETYVNGTSWYRIYSDNSCEQGGQGIATSAASDYTIAFLKTMANTDYSVSLTLNRTSSPSGDYYATYSTKTQSNLTIQCRPTGFCWEVKGYLASTNS